jgi:hypothetical protein
MICEAMICEVIICEVVGPAVKMSVRGAAAARIAVKDPTIRYSIGP